MTGLDACATACRRLFQGLLLCAAVALPVLTLAVRGGANGSYFLFALAALASALCAGRPVVQHAPPGRLGTVMPVVLALPLASVLFTQWATADFHAGAFDAPARFLLAAVLLWLLWRLPGLALRHVQWGFMAGALLAPMALWVAGGDGAAGRPQPVFATAITFGNIGLVLGVCTLLSLGWRLTGSPLERPLKLLAGAAGIYASILSQSRGGWLAVPVLLVSFILMSRWCRRRKLALLGLSMLMMVASYHCSHTIQSRMALAVSEYRAFVQADGAAAPHGPTSSVGLRLQFWRTALKIFHAAPLTGIGAQNMRQEFARRAEAGQIASAATRFSHVHNEYLQAMAAYGLPGLLARLGIYLVPVWVFVRAMRAAERDRATAGRIGFAIVVSFMVFGLTETMFAITMNASFYCGLLVVMLVLAQAPPAGARAGSTGRPNV